MTGSDPEKTLQGFDGMLSLAEKGYMPAMYQVAYTYVWAPKDSLSLLRKKNLGLVTDSLGLLVENTKNEEAMTWLKKTIQASDSANYQAMSWLAQYYLNGMVVNRDIEVAIKLLNKSKNEALKKRDKEYIEKINKVLSRIKEIEHGNE